MHWKEGLSQPGVLAALGAALLFGAGTPLAKLLLSTVSPWLLAGLLYLGSGIGLALYRHLSRAPKVQLQPVKRHGSRARLSPAALLAHCCSCSG